MTNQTCNQLISKPERQPQAKRGIWAMVTAIFWLFYLHLWMPLLTLLLWLFGIRGMLYELYLRDTRFEPFLFSALPVILVACATLLIGWAEINRFRFTGRDRRMVADVIEQPQIAASLGASATFGREVTRHKVQTIHLNDQARPIAITPLTVPPLY